MSAVRRLDLVLPDAQPGARAVLKTHLALLEDLAADATPWEWRVDQWARNGWTIVQNGSAVNLEKTEDHARDDRCGEFGAPCPVERFPSAEAAVRHILDMLRSVVRALRPVVRDAVRDDAERVSAWILALAATRHPCGSLPDMVRMPSPHDGGASRPAGGSEHDPIPPGAVRDMLTQAPCVLEWHAGSWSGNEWVSINAVERLCGPDRDVDPCADPIATLRAIERVKEKIE